MARKMANSQQNQDWEAATWEGSRRVQLRAALSMTLRQRFEALEELAALAQKLATMPRACALPSRKGLGGAHTPHNPHD